MEDKRYTLQLTDKRKESVTEARVIAYAKHRLELNPCDALDYMALGSIKDVMRTLYGKRVLLSAHVCFVKLREVLLYDISAGDAAKIGLKNKTVKLITKGVKDINLSLKFAVEIIESHGEKVESKKEGATK